MKGHSYTALILSIITCTLFSHNAWSQGSIGAFISAGKSDIKSLSEAYIAPWYNILGTGLNAGWGSSAGTLPPGNFEIKVGLTGVLPVKHEQQYDIRQLNLSQYTQPVDQNFMTPTITGYHKSGAPIDIVYNGQKVGSFVLPQGVNKSFTPIPQIQLSAGLPKGIELKLQTVPKVKFVKEGLAATFEMMGGGVRYGLTTMLRENYNIPFDVSFAMGYNHFNYTMESEDIPSSANTLTQQLKGYTSAVYAEISGSIPIANGITPFLTLGYQQARSGADVNINYGLTVNVNGIPLYVPIKEQIVMDKKQIWGLSGTMGLQYQYYRFKLHASYSLALYNNFNVGIGIHIGRQEEKDFFIF